MSGRDSVSRPPHAGVPGQATARGRHGGSCDDSDGGAGVALDAARHFEALRAPVRHRLRAQHRALCAERFDDAYSEWWAREVERAAAGRPSRAAAPVAFVAESVHRVLVDEARGRARGLPRGEKAALRITQLEALTDAGAVEDTEAQARYEALAHRILDLVRHRLTARELRVFVCTFLYLQSTDATARQLGLSRPRVKKDRVKAAAKLGDEVWDVVVGELDVCPAHDDRDLPAVFEALADHVEECDACAPSFRGLRSGALAVLPPVQLLAPTSDAGTAGPLAWLYDRLLEAYARWSTALAALPAGGRAVTTAVVAATAVAGGGAAAVVTVAAADRPSDPSAVVASPSTTPVGASPVPAVGRAAERSSGRRDTRPSSRRRRPERSAASRPAAIPAPTPTAATPAPTPAAPPEPPVQRFEAPAPGATPSSPGEFGFEQG